MAAVSVLSVLEVPRDIKDLGSHECLIELRTPAAAAATAQLSSRDAATASPIFTPAPEATSLGLAAASSKSCAPSVHAAKPAPVISLSPAKCSMQFHNSLEHKVSASAAVSTLEKLDQMLRRYYITDFNHAYSIGVDVFYSAFDIHGVEMVFGKWISQCLMQFWPFSAPLIVKVSWLPSPFVLFASVHLRLRPLPWPFLCGSAAPEPSTMKHVPQLSWEEDRVLPWPTFKIGNDFGVHSVDSDLGLGVVPSSGLPLAWDPGGLGQIIYSWHLLFAISPEFSSVPSNQRICKCAVNLELPWLFFWNYGLIHWIDGMPNVPVVLLPQTFMLLPQQHGDGLFTVSNVQTGLQPWHPPHMQAEFEYCTVEVHPLPWPSFPLGIGCFVSQAVCWNPPWSSFNMLTGCSVSCCGRLWKPPWYVPIQQTVRCVLVIRNVLLPFSLHLPSQRPVQLFLTKGYGTLQMPSYGTCKDTAEGLCADCQAQQIVVSGAGWSLDGDNHTDAIYPCVGASFVDAGWELQRRAAEVFLEHSISESRTGLLIGVDNWDNVHVMVAVTIAETGATLWFCPAVIWLSNWLCSRMLWKPPWELLASVESVDDGLENMVVDHADKESDHGTRHLQLRRGKYNSNFSHGDERSIFVREVHHEHAFTFYANKFCAA